MRSPLSRTPTLSAIITSLVATMLLASVPMGRANAQSATMLVTSNENPSAYGDVLTFTAFVNAYYLGGTVTFYDGSQSLATVPVQGNGSATFSLSQLSIGNHTITATYNGDGMNPTMRSNAFQQNVGIGNSYYNNANYYNNWSYSNGSYYNNGYNNTYYNTPTSVTITSNRNPASDGDLVTFTGRVIGQYPSGTVTFYDNGASIGTAGLTSDGRATFTTSLSVGAHGIVARYNGDARNSSSSSSIFNQTINPRTYYYNNYNYYGSYNYQRPIPVFQLPPYPQPTYSQPWRQPYYQQNYPHYQYFQHQRPQWWR